MKVYVVDVGDYEDNGIVYVAATLDAAVKAIRSSEYGTHESVHFGELEASSDDSVFYISADVTVSDPDGHWRDYKYTDTYKISEWGVIE